MDSFRKSQLMRNSVELQELKRKLDAKLISAEQSNQIQEKLKNKQLNNIKNKEEVSIAEKLSESRLDDNNDTKNKEHNKNYLNGLKAQIENKNRKKLEQERETLAERERLEAEAKKFIYETQEKINENIMKKQRLIEGLESDVKTKNEMKNREKNKEALIEIQIRDYQIKKNELAKKHNIKKDETINKRKMLTEK
ncbi:MAG: hypothetical protein MHPSP_004049, partial [Paramarteilia canceri]